MMEFPKAPTTPSLVIPAQAGIHITFTVMDGRSSKLRPTASFSRLRGNDKTT